MDAAAVIDRPAAVAVTPPLHTGTVERTSVRIAASPLTPGNAGVLPCLVHELAVEIAGAPVRPTPAMLRAATARVVAGSTWSHYRAGAQRLASLGAVYLNWHLPSADHRFMAVPFPGRVALRFDAPDGTWSYDELVVGGYEADLGDRLEALLATGDADFTGIRVIALSDPGASYVVAATDRAREVTAAGALVGAVA